MNIASDQDFSYSTIRLQCPLPDGGKSCGTGFFFGYRAEDDSVVPVVVTNKHVLGDAEKVIFSITPEDDTRPLGRGDYYSFEFEGAQAMWIGHPDPNIDLGVLIFGAIINKLKSDGLSPHFRYFTEDDIPPQSHLETLTGIEDIYMVGYPNALWDSVHNMPIVRRGITATDPRLNYRGKREFVIDCACFPGSSGSPVILHNPVGRRDAKGGIIMGTKPYLMGILWGGHEFTINGDIVPREIPSAVVPSSRSSIPMNLGLAVNAACLMDLRGLVLDKAAEPSGKPSGIIRSVLQSSVR